MNIKTNHCIESLICTFPDFYTFPVSTVLLYHNSLYLISYRLYLNSSTSTAQQGTRSTSTRYSLYPLQLYLNSSTSYSLYLNQLLALPQQLNKMTIQTIKLWLLWLILFKGYPRLPAGFPQGYPQGYPLCPSDWLWLTSTPTLRSGGPIVRWNYVWLVNSLACISGRAMDVKQDWRVRRPSLFTTMWRGAKDVREGYFFKFHTLIETGSPRARRERNTEMETAKW